MNLVRPMPVSVRVPLLCVRAGCGDCSRNCEHGISVFGCKRKHGNLHCKQHQGMLSSRGDVPL